MIIKNNLGLEVSIEEATQEVLREIYKDERATDVFKEMFYGGK